MNTRTEQIERLNARIQTWEDALDACAAGQSYTIGSRSLTRFDIASITAQLDRLYRQRAALEGNLVTRTRVRLAPR